MLRVDQFKLNFLERWFSNRGQKNKPRVNFFSVWSLWKKSFFFCPPLFINWCRRKFYLNWSTLMCVCEIKLAKLLPSTSSIAVDVVDEAHLPVVESVLCGVVNSSCAGMCRLSSGKFLSINQFFAHVNARNSHSYWFAYQMGQINCRTEWHLNRESKHYRVAFCCRVFRTGRESLMCSLAHSTTVLARELCARVASEENI